MNKAEKFIDYTQNLSRLCINQKKLIYILFVFLGILCASIAYISVHKIEYLIPYNMNEKVFVSVSAVSPEYLSAIAMADAATYFNVDRYNVDTQTQIFLSRIDPGSMGRVSIALNERKKKIISDNLAQVFYPMNFYVKKNSHLVVLKGRLQKWLSSKLVQSNLIIVSIDYSNMNGHVYIKQWNYKND